MPKTMVEISKHKCGWVVGGGGGGGDSLVHCLYNVVNSLILHLHVFLFE